MATMSQDPNALGVLTRLRSLSNMTPGGDGFVNKRRAQIVSGEDDLAPSEFEQFQVQDQMGGRVSRDMIRDAGIQGLKQRLGIINAEAQAKLQPEIVKGEYGVKAAEVAARASADRLKYTQDSINGRTEKNQEAILSRLDKSLGSRSDLQEDRQQFEVDHPNANSGGPTQGTLTQLQKLRESAPGNALSKWWRGGAYNDQLKGALANVLEQKGTLGPVSAAAAAIKQGAQLNDEEQQWLQGLGPHEQEYLKLLTGQ